MGEVGYNEQGLRRMLQAEEVNMCENGVRKIPSLCGEPLAALCCWD